MGQLSVQMGSNQCEGTSVCEKKEHSTSDMPSNYKCDSCAAVSKEQHKAAAPPSCPS